MATPQVQLGPRFVDAVGWATELHADQGRKGRPDVPYVSHLLAVAALTLEDGGEEDDAIVALCHDAAEDQGGHTTLAEVRRRFGDHVAECVDLLSDSHGCHDEDKEPWAERKARLLAQLARPDVPTTVLRVAAADKLHNARSIVNALEVQGDATWDRFRAPPGDLVWFYQSVADLLAERFPGSVNVPELQRACTALARWAEGAPVPKLA